MNYDLWTVVCFLAGVFNVGVFFALGVTFGVRVAVKLLGFPINVTVAPVKITHETNERRAQG